MGATIAEVATWNTREVDNLDLEHRSDHPLVTVGPRLVSKVPSDSDRCDPRIGTMWLAQRPLLRTLLFSHMPNPAGMIILTKSLIDRNSPCKTLSLIHI